MPKDVVEGSGLDHIAQQPVESLRGKKHVYTNLYSLI